MTVSLTDHHFVSHGAFFPKTSIMRGIGAGQRIFELLDRRPAIPMDNYSPSATVLSPTRRGPLRFENVKFSYPSRRGVEVLSGFDLEVGVGESVAIVGTSGSGKSSVQSLLLRYYDPIGGRVTFDGQGEFDFLLSSLLRRRMFQFTNYPC